jgi:hypothetical protein
MELLRKPLVVFALGVVAGLVFGSKLKSLPGVNKLPSVG